MCLSRNKKKNVYPYKPQFYYIKVGLKGERGGGGTKLYRYVFVMRSVFFLLNLEDLKMLLLIETLIYFDVRLYFFYQMFEHFF